MKYNIYHIGLGLAIALLLCLASMPYGYYNLVRFIAMIIFSCMAVAAYNKERIYLSIIFASLALLFQSFIKIVLGKTIWNIIDVIVAIALIILWYKNNKKID